ncbi:hypothetical protein Hanom_Chr16g01492861 [Helianthus anomalus]
MTDPTVFPVTQEASHGDNSRRWRTMVALFGMWQWLKLVVVSDGRPDGSAPTTGAVTARVQAADLFISEVLSITVNYCNKMKLIWNGIHHKPQLVMWMEIVT